MPCSIMFMNIFMYQCTVMILNFRTDRSVQTMQEQSDQGLHCLLFHLHVFDKIPSGLVLLIEF